MTNLISLVAGVIARAQGYVACAFVSALAAGLASGWAVHRIDHESYVRLELADARAAQAALALTASRQKAADQINLDAALKESQAQQKIVTETVTVTKEVAVHVPDVRACIPYGLVRVLDQAATGRDPAGFGVPAGQPDDACAPISWRDFAGDIADDYGIGRQNAEQLNALEDDIRALAKADHS